MLPVDGVRVLCFGLHTQRCALYSGFANEGSLQLQLMRACPQMAKRWVVVGSWITAACGESVKTRLESQVSWVV
jgi:hypothetical protein